MIATLMPDVRRIDPLEEIIFFNDERLLKDLEEIRMIREYDEETSKSYGKLLRETIRMQIGTSNVIGFAYVTSKETGKTDVAVFQFPIKATHKNEFELHWDADKNRPYIEVDARFEDN